MVSVLEKPELKRVWPDMGEGLSIRTEEDYDRAVEILNHLLDEVGDDEKHPLFNFVEVLGTLIESYEADHIEIPKSSPQEIIRFLMEQNNLKQSDLPEIGPQSIVSEILKGKRELNARQIKALSKRFSISPEAFFG